MRLHTLEISAFGPFADTVRVDFDALSEANVFLLCGDTGAGKTTVLDAVCFAFYGDVPSERSAARQLRSHHAEPGVAPRVVLEASLSGRRFRFTRQPSWQRPKKRGSGTTTEQAHVVVEELVAGSWAVLTTRLDEAGHLVTGLVGMTVGQFSQVAMLPQGQFDTFLRAPSEERQKVLTHLFRTRRFEDVERWLVERRTTLRRAGEKHAAAVTALLHRVSEAAAVGVPAWELEVAAGSDEVTGWSRSRLDESASASTAAAADVATAATRLETAVAAHDDARRLHELRTRHAAAVETAASLAATADEARTVADRLDAARRAAVVAPGARAADAAARSLAMASDRVAAAVAAAAGAIGSGAAEPDHLTAQAREADARAAVATAFLPRARELEEARTTVLRSADELDRLAVVRTEHAARLEALPARRLVADERVAACRAAEARLPQARTLMIDLGRRLSQFAVAEELEFQVSDAQRKRDEQHLVTVALREELLDLRERRLQGMAAELASAMAVGADCPVCGSHDHPHPAVPSPGSPSKADEQQVRARLDDAEVDLLSHDDHMRGYRARLLVVREALGAGTSDETLAELEAARLDAEGCAADAATLGSAQTDLLTVADEERAEHDALARLEAHVARLTERRDLAERTVASLSAELQELLGSPGGANDVSDLAATSSRAARVLTEARDALVAESRLREAADEASSRAAETAVAQGFADLGTAQSAMLSDDAVDDLAERVATRGEAETACRLVLDDPEVVAAASAPRVDLDQVHAAREQATRDHGSAVARARSAEATLKRLMELDAALSAALAAWEPVRRDHALVRSLSEFAEGKGAHNTRQMRLSAYVLAARLGQVVAAANERLVKMSDDRYTLEHTAERGVGERRGGLSLRVRDQWTDETRDPVTLSGGETFVVSLALALGLADVVTAEAGGARVDTLFVDEGFGSLDADTLELVMDTLDQLRAGGRVVGLVSHVPELRSRIPAQLQVLKTRHGSALVQQVSATR